MQTFHYTHLYIMITQTQKLYPNLNFTVPYFFPVYYPRMRADEAPALNCGRLVYDRGERATIVLLGSIAELNL